MCSDEPTGEIYLDLVPGEDDEGGGQEDGEQKDQDRVDIGLKILNSFTKIIIPLDLYKFAPEQNNNSCLTLFIKFLS